MSVCAGARAHAHSLVDTVNIGVGVNVDHVIADGVQASAGASEQSGALNGHVYVHRNCSHCAPQSRSDVALH